MDILLIYLALFKVKVVSMREGGEIAKCYRLRGGVAMVEFLRSSGVCASVTVVSGSNSQTTPLMELKRYAIGANCGIGKFKQRVNHIITQGQELIRRN